MYVLDDLIDKMLEIREKRYNFEHTHMEMHNQFIRKDGVLANPPPYLAALSQSHSSGNKISPAVLFVIVILAVLFFVSGLLHLLVRFLSKHPSSSSQSNDRYPEMLPSDALQRQLQQLFHLHDSGLDQAFIDALPVFMYKEIGNVANEPFDCAVCLCEFTEKDQLRLLPVCSHAFHIDCIDTWLLTNSTCPLCRGALFTPGISIENPAFDFDDFRDDEGFPQNVENGYVPRQKTMEIEENAKGKGVLKVRLGKFRKMGNGDDVADVGETSSSNLDARRCYSMGSYQYVVGHKNLKVAFSGDQSSRHMRFERGLKANIDPTITDGDMDGKKLSIGSKTDSYSVSKIWLWSKKGKFASSSDSQ